MCNESSENAKLNSLLKAVDERDSSPDVKDFDEEAFVDEIKKGWNQQC